MQSTRIDGQPAEKDLPAGSSMWPVDSLSTFSEVLVVFVACMSQFCTRKWQISYRSEINAVLSSPPNPRVFLSYLAKEDWHLSV